MEKMEKKTLLELVKQAVATGEIDKSIELAKTATEDEREEVREYLARRLKWRYRYAGR